MYKYYNSLFLRVWFALVQTEGASDEGGRGPSTWDRFRQDGVGEKGHSCGFIQPIQSMCISHGSCNH